MTYSFLMTRKDLIKKVLTENQLNLNLRVWERTLQIPLDTDKIITLVGVRRSGKTYQLLHLIRKLKRMGVSDAQILYLNFEDERLNLKVSELDLILQSYSELHPEVDLAQCYFFFDEIQEAHGWEKFVARIYNTVTKHIFITGSNANLLSKEIATALRGRTITFEIFTLSFKEFVSILSPDVNIYSTQGQAKLRNLFAQFLQQGGFPELLKQSDELRAKVLQQYFNTMVLRDIIERYDVAQANILKYFCKRVVANSAGEFSVNKIYNELKSLGYQISKDSLYAYQGYTEAIYLNLLISKYSHSTIKTEMSQKKSYVIDQGLGAALDFKLSQDRGRLLETTVALELLKQGKQIAYAQNGYECDFVCMERGHVTAAMQVAYDLLDAKTRAREIKGLVRACQDFDLVNGVIITHDLEEDIVIDNIQIKIIPAWKYFYAV